MDDGGVQVIRLDVIQPRTLLKAPAQNGRQHEGTPALPREQHVAIGRLAIILVERLREMPNHVVRDRMRAALIPNAAEVF